MGIKTGILPCDTQTFLCKNLLHPSVLVKSKKRQLTSSNTGIKKEILTKYKIRLMAKTTDVPNNTGMNKDEHNGRN